MCTSSVDDWLQESCPIRQPLKFQAFTKNWSSWVPSHHTQCRACSQIHISIYSSEFLHRTFAFSASSKTPFLAVHADFVSSGLALYFASYWLGADGDWIFYGGHTEEVNSESFPWNKKAKETNAIYRWTATIWYISFSEYRNRNTSGKEEITNPSHTSHDIQRCEEDEYDQLSSASLLCMTALTPRRKHLLHLFSSDLDELRFGPQPPLAPPRLPWLPRRRRAALRGGRELALFGRRRVALFVLVLRRRRHVDRPQRELGWRCASELRGGGHFKMSARLGREGWGGRGDVGEEELLAWLCLFLYDSFSLVSSPTLDLLSLPYMLSSTIISCYFLGICLVFSLVKITNLIISHLYAFK